MAESDGLQASLQRALDPDNEASAGGSPAEQDFPPILDPNEDAGAPEPTIASSVLEDVRAAFASARTPQEIGDALVEGLMPSFAAVLVLVVKGDAAMGWRGRAPAEDPEMIESVIVPFGEPSVLARAHARHGVVVERPSLDEQAIHRRLWRMLKLEPPEELAAVPVLLKDRVVNIIYVHPHPGTSLPSNTESVLQTLAGAAGEAFAGLIRARRG